MKAVVYPRIGPPEVLEVQEVEKPAANENQVLIKVAAASVNAMDYRRFSGQLEGGQAPLMTRALDRRMLKDGAVILGADIAGRVEAVGADVTMIQPGDEVFGVAARGMGGFAEYACARETNVVRKPANTTFEEAAAVPVAGLTALQALRDHGKVQPGEKVLVYGASGGVGIFTVQIAKYYGAEVTAVVSTRNMEMARENGADHVMDYTKEDFSRQEKQYDLIVAVNGYRPILAYRRALAPGGRYVGVGGKMKQIFQDMLLGPLFSRFGERKMRFMGVGKVTQDDLLVLAELLADGHIKPVIEQRYPLSQTAEAIRYVAGGHAQAKVIIHME